MPGFDTIDLSAHLLFATKAASDLASNMVDQASTDADSVSSETTLPPYDQIALDMSSVRHGRSEYLLIAHEMHAAAVRAPTKLAA